MPTQFTTLEMLEMIGGDSWTRDWFLKNQVEATERVNARLRGEEHPFAGSNEEYVQARVDRRVKDDARELEHKTKYSGILPHVAEKMELGAILVSSWGYEQTNVDFYVVVEMTAKMVKLLSLYKRTHQEDGYCSMAGKTTATNDINFRGEMLKKKIQNGGYSGGGYVKIESYAYAKLWDGKKEYESWYA
jgi:hypothetical protein